MPIPSGSKGPIEPIESAHASPSFRVARDLWNGFLDVEEAEESLRDLGLALDTLTVETNQACPLRCTYCYLQNRPKVEPVDFEVLTRFLDQALEAGVKQFGAVGKEPFADGRAMSLLEHVDRLPGRSKCRVGVVTNGILTRRYLDRLQHLSRPLDYIDISLDGPADANDRVRGLGSFAKTMAAIQALADFPNLVVAATVHAGTVDTLIPFLFELWQRNVRTVSFSPVLDLTNDPRVASLCLRPEELFGRVLHELSRHASTVQDRQIVVDLPLEWTAYGVHRGHIPISQVREDKNGCTYFQPKGDVPLYLKVQLLPQNAWRWARITADGYFLGSLRLASSPDYRDGAVGSIIGQTFAELHAESLNRKGWLTDDWNEAIRWATDQALPASGLLVLA